MTDEEYRTLREQLDEVEQLKAAGDPLHRQRYESALEYANRLLDKAGDE